MLNIEKLSKAKFPDIPALGSWPGTRHVFDERTMRAVNAAFFAQRPLLIEGEPGVGKSQLARAVAVASERAFIYQVVHAHTECLELQWRFDPVARLGEAQAIAASGKVVDIKEVLDPLKYVTPGPLWWALNWEDAIKQREKCGDKGQIPTTTKGWKKNNGSVVLIDEIDKADADLPNGLLEVLGNGSFSVPYLSEAVKLKKGMNAPLIIITTNGERELPAAFLRRCLVLRMKLPKEKEKLISWLVKRGKHHVKNDCNELLVKESVLKEAAEQLWEDRSKALEQNLPAPGQAEYIDMLKALVGMESDKEKQSDVLKGISEFMLQKYSEDI